MLRLNNATISGGNQLKNVPVKFEKSPPNPTRLVNRFVKVETTLAKPSAKVARTVSRPLKTAETAEAESEE